MPTPGMPAPKFSPRGLGNLVIIGGFAMLLLRAVSPADFLFGFLRKSLKLAWRLLVLVNVGKFALGFLGKMAMNVMMSGGPIKAMKKSFWGGTTSLFDELASLCSRVGALSGLAAKFDDLAQVCDARASDIGGGNPFGDLGSAMGDGADPFGGGGDMSGFADMFGAADGADPFGGADSFGGASLGSAAPPPDEPPAPPPPGVSINIKKPGD